MPAQWMRSFRLADRLHWKETAAVDEAGFGSRIARRSRAHYRDAAIFEARPRRADRAWPRLRASDRATADFGAGPGGTAAAGDQQLGISDRRSADDPLAFRTSTAICAAASPSAISTPSATTGGSCLRCAPRLKPLRPGYFQLKTPIAEVKPAILGQPEFVAFNDSAIKLFEGWKDANTPGRTRIDGEASPRSKISIRPQAAQSQNICRSSMMRPSAGRRRLSRRRSPQPIRRRATPLRPTRSPVMPIPTTTSSI